MSAERRQLGIDVLAAARLRIAKVFDWAPRVYVSFSGGKDSTVMLHLVMEEATRRGRRVGVLFIDLEAQYRLTIEHVARCLDMYRDHIDEHWVALPLNLRNAVSQYEPQWMCWDPDRRSDWVRRPPKRAIVDEARFPFFRRRMEFEDFVPEFATWYARGETCACFVGIRAQESLNRWRSIASTTKSRFRNACWTTEAEPGVFNAYPIYDWQTEDIWTFHGRNPDLPSNGLYDLMSRAGLTIHQQRICQPYGDDQRKGLWLYHLIEPETWGRVVARVNGANQGALYAQESGNILGIQKVTRPEGHTWESFAGLLLASMPAPTTTHYRTKIDVFLRWWERRGYERGIPDEAAPDMEAARRVPSWRRICKALLRNDYWCKGLSFTQHKSEATYARYCSIMRARHSEWGFDRPDTESRPSSKQLAMLAALVGGSSPHHAYRAIGRVVGMSASAATKRATREDATRAIEALRGSDERQVADAPLESRAVRWENKNV